MVHFRPPLGKSCQGTPPFALRALVPNAHAVKRERGKGLQGTHFVSVIIPNRNGGATIGKCLEAAFSSRFEGFEVIVVDDASEDQSVEIIEGFPCRLIRLEQHSGASRARNVGALESVGDILFFIDADCLLMEDTLSIAQKSLFEEGEDAVIGGSYTPVPYDGRFFSLFQSVFVNFSETRSPRSPDYIAAHAMVMEGRVFRESGGFPEEFLPILEDVELSHRLRRSGYRLVMNPDLLVRHIFNFSLLDSIRNAIRKSMYWTMYSMGHRDVLADSGTASRALKFNVISQLIILLWLLLWIWTGKPFLWAPIPPTLALNLLINMGLIRAFFRAKGFLFAILALFYYLTLYAFAVAAGAFAGIVRYALYPYPEPIH